MCMVLYLATDTPLPHGDPGTEVVVALNPAEAVPVGLEGKAHVYEVVTWGGGRPCCSCTFIETINPWEEVSAYDLSDPETASTFADYDRLRAFCRAALKADPAPLLLWVLDGDERKAPADSRDAVPEDFAPGRFTLHDVEGGRSDMHRLFRLHAGRA